MKETNERTCREYGWIPVREVLGATSCPLLTFMIEAMPDTLAEVEQQLAHGGVGFVSDFLSSVSHAADWCALLKEQGYATYDYELRIPEGLSDFTLQLLLDMRSWLAERGDVNTGGCRAFYSPAEYRQWRQVPDSVVCVIGHDGGSLAPYFNLSYCDYEAFDDMTEFVDLRGFWCECQTSGETYVYRL